MTGCSLIRHVQACIGRCTRCQEDQLACERRHNFRKGQACVPCGKARIECHWDDTELAPERVRKRKRALGDRPSTADSDFTDDADDGGMTETLGASGKGTRALRAASGPNRKRRYERKPGRSRSNTVDGADDEDDGDVIDADDEHEDNNKYCSCQDVSFGKMIACDNDNCPYEWFHFSCEGLKQAPIGTWYCSFCTENIKRVEEEVI
jgi:hypothetical protein